MANASNYCFVGDSRFVGMKQAAHTDKNIVWIAKVGADQSWYWKNRDIITNLDRNTIVIYELGVNDIDSARCLDALSDLRELGFKQVYFTSVTPVDEYEGYRHGYSRTNEEIEKFNEEVRNSLPESVDTMYCYEYLIQTGIETMDGLHYESSTYRSWFDYIMDAQAAWGESGRFGENSSEILKFAIVIPARISRFPYTQRHFIKYVNKVFIWIPIEYLPRNVYV